MQTIRILEAALTLYGEKLLVTTGLNAGGVLLCHYLTLLDPKHPIYFIDSGKLFRETIAYRDYLIAQHKFNIKTVGPVVTDEADFEKKHGELWKTSPDACCRIRKVEPANKLISQHEAWVSALRREQGNERRQLPLIHQDGPILKIYPLLRYTREQINEELASAGIMQHPLHDAGYQSIGCWPCTICTLHAERDGRWPTHNKTECGIHNKRS